MVKIIKKDDGRKGKIPDGKKLRKKAHASIIRGSEPHLEMVALMEATKPATEDPFLDFSWYESIPTIIKF